MANIFDLANIDDDDIYEKLTLTNYMKKNAFMI